MKFNKFLLLLCVVVTISSSLLYARSRPSQPQSRNICFVVDTKCPIGELHLVLTKYSTVLNAFQMTEFSTGLYYLPSHLDVENYFGGGYNKIVIDSNEYFNKLVDSVTFGSAIHITNVPVGKVVGRQQNFVINFTGATSGSLVEYTLKREWVFDQPEDTNSLHTTNGICYMGWNTGQIIISAEALEILRDGYYTLTCFAYEPKYIPLSNGKEICVLGLSEHKVTIKIED